MNTTPKPSQIIIMASGAVMFLFSFFAFFTNGDSFNAWSGDVGTLFMATWPALFGLIAAGSVAAVLFGNVTVPDRILTFSHMQLVFVLAFASFVILFGYLLGGGIPDFGGFGGPSKGFGFIFMLLGSIGLLVGAVMELLGTGQSDSTGPAASGPAQPF